LIEPKFTKNEIDFLIDEFSIRTDCINPFEFKGVNEKTRVYQIDDLGISKKLVLDSTLWRDIACYSSIVGERLDKMVLKASFDAAKLLKNLGYVKNLDEVIFESVLRAGDGYKLREAFETFGINFRRVWIRPKYIIKTEKNGNRSHRVKRLVIDNENFEQIPENKKLCLIKPDTEATGKTSEISIKRTVEVARGKGSEIKKLVLYGFISETGLSFVEQIAKEVGIEEVVAIPIGNLTALCSNEFDMPLYGPDESQWVETKEIRKLGSTSSRKTLYKYVPAYIPGLDQPADWSDKQAILFNGYGYEPGDITGHLKKTIGYVKNLREILHQMPSVQDFLPRYDSMIERELSRLKRQLQNYTVKI